MPASLLRRLLVSGLVLVAAACGADEPAAPAADACAGLVGAEIVRVVPHLGAGFEVLLRLRADGGHVPEAGAALARCVQVTARDGRPLTSATQPRRLDRAFTLLLVEPGSTPAENQLALAMVSALVARRSDGEQVAIYRWADRVEQVAAFGGDDAFLLERAAAGLFAHAGASLPATQALVAAAPALTGVGGLGWPALRSIVLVTPRAATLVPPEAPAAVAPHLLLRLGPLAPPVRPELPPAQRFSFPTRSGLPAAADRLTAALARWRADGHVGVGLCGDAAGRVLAVHAGRDPAAALDFVTPTARDEDRTGACDPAALAAGQRPFPRRLELIFTEAERTRADDIFKRVIGAEDGDGKEAFPLSVRLSPEHAPVPASAHYRGQSSAGCERHNYTLDLDGKSPRFLFPGSAIDQFHLISLCLDRLYLRNIVALRVMADEGLFPVPFDLVEVVSDGRSQGVYLLVENIADSLRQQISGLTAVVRRYTAEGRTFPEVKWSAGSVDAAVASYDRLLAGTEGLAGEVFERALRGRMNLGQYLRWVALMALLGSGDYIDEVFFYASRTTASANGAGASGDSRPETFQVMGWDQDDLFSDCHFRGALAVYDPRGLLYCTESELDRRIFSDPILYRRYAEALRDTVARLTPERFGRAAHTAAEQILQVLRTREARAGSLELKALVPDEVEDPEALRAAFDAEAALLTNGFAHNRERLARALATVDNLYAP